MKALCKLDAVELSVRHAIALESETKRELFHPLSRRAKRVLAARRSLRRKETRLAMEVM